MSTYDLVICNGAAEDNGPVSCNLGIRDGRIAARQETPLDGHEAVDARGRLVSPGFVNAHTHLDKSDLLGRMEPGDFGKSLEENRELLKKFKRDYEHGELKRRAAGVLREMVAQGVTAIRSQVDVDTTAGLVPARALLELAEECRDYVRLSLCAFPQEGLLRRETRELVEEALRLGVQAVGGNPYVEAGEDDRRAHVDRVFELAGRLDRDIEIQVDESNSPGDFLLPYIVEKAAAAGMGGRVSVTHVISLAAVEDEAALPVMDGMARAGMNVIVTPSCNMITRFPAGVKRRGANSITRVKELLERGVNVALGTDNIRDIFYPLGNGSMLREMHVAAVALRMTEARDAGRLFRMARRAGAGIMGLDYGLGTGRLADLVVAEAPSQRAALAGVPSAACVVSGGRVVAGTQWEAEFSGPAAAGPAEEE